MQQAVQHLPSHRPLGELASQVDAAHQEFAAADLGLKDEPQRRLVFQSSITWTMGAAWAAARRGYRP